MRSLTPGPPAIVVLAKLPSARRKGESKKSGLNSISDTVSAHCGEANHERSACCGEVVPRSGESPFLRKFARGERCDFSPAIRVQAEDASGVRVGIHTIPRVVLRSGNSATTRGGFL